VFGLFDRKKRKAERGRHHELQGDLDHAVKAYLDAELRDEAARVLLVKADAESDPEKRLLVCAQAARVGDGTPPGEEAKRRKARLAFDLLKNARGGLLQGELLRAGAELEAVGEWERAAEAYALAGDAEGEIRALQQGGAIERLEERLRETDEVQSRDRDRTQLLRKLRDLDRIAERREALRAARAFLERGHDEQVALERDRIRGRLLTGPIVELVVGGQKGRWVLGSQVTIGRAESQLIVHSGSVSRQHLRLFRKEGAAWVEDLATRNGTTLHGARVSGALPVGQGLDLELAGEVPCRLVADGGADAPVAVELAGERHLCPLGPLRIGDWQIVDAHDGDDQFVVLRTPAGTEPPYCGEFRLALQVELAAGDELSSNRGGAVVLAVPGATPSLRGIEGEP
jgi:FHA domain-containing protein